MADATAYAELDVASNFSFLEGASHPEELVACAAQLGLQAIGIADRGTMSGMVRAHVAAKEHGIALCVGARLDLDVSFQRGSGDQTDPACPHEDGPPRRLEVLAYATDLASYGRLCRAITTGRMRCDGQERLDRGTWSLTLHQFLELAQGLEIIAQPPAGAGLLSDHVIQVLRGMRGVVGDRLSLAVVRVGEPEEGMRVRQIRFLGDECSVPLVVTNGVRFHAPHRRQLHDVLTAIRHGTTVGAAGLALLPNAERQLQGAQCMHRRWRDFPEALARGIEIANRCAGFSLAQLRYTYPSEVVPAGRSAMEHLRTLVDIGANERYPSGVPESVHAQLAHECALIDELKYANYFLTVHDLVRFARSRSILCQGRGAAANSVVCYCLGVTAVDPKRIQVLFERFLSRERSEPPDIDIDFEHERREEVMQYIYARYGRQRAALCAEVVCYRRRLAIRETAKALGFSLDAVDRLARGLSSSTTDDEIRSLGFDPASSSMTLLLQMAGQLEGFPRHLSQHSGGFIITEGPLCELVPIREATMEGRTMIEWDKDDIDAMGMLKIDVLALGMLTCIRKALASVGAELHTVPSEDPQTYAMMSRADTVGVFQIESRAQMSMLPRLRPACFYDLVIEVAIVRPGPIQGDMVHPYLRRRCGEEVATYPSEAIRTILGRTLGIPLFQEQAMALAVAAAGFTPGEADQLRRALSSWKRSGNQIERFQAQLESGMRQRGYSMEFAQQVFRQLQGFSGYGFPESHAASFAHLVYASSWLKRHHPAAFTCALLNSQPMGFYAPAQLVQDAQRHGVEVRRVDVAHSRWDCTLEDCGGGELLGGASDDPSQWGRGGPAIRLGMRMVRGLTETDAEAVEAVRVRLGHCDSLEELWRGSGASVSAMRQLARADAFQSMGLDRQAALWQAQRLRGEEAPLFTQPLPPDLTDCLPPVETIAEVASDYANLGLSLKAHPMSFARAWLVKRGVATCEDMQQEHALPAGTRTAIAGLVLVRQRPATAKGIVFITIEDETGSANLIVRPAVWERVRSVGRHASVMIAHGKIERRNESTHLIVSRLEAMSWLR